MVEAKMPLPVVDTLESVIGFVLIGVATRDRNLTEHAEGSTTFNMFLVHSSNPSPLGETDVLLGLLVPVPHDGPGGGIGAIGHPRGGAVVRAHFNHELSLLMRIIQARGLDQDSVSVDSHVSII